jgi:hypothetical protein
MPLIRCTKKLLAEVGVAASPATSPSGNALLGDWYANLLRIERKKCVIFAGERTLLTFMVPGLGRSAIRRLPDVLRNGLRELLRNEGFAAHIVARVVSEYQELAVAPTVDRRVLGSLNDLSRMAEAHVLHNGGIQACDLHEINHRLNETPMSLLQMASPIAMTKRLLGGDDTIGVERRTASTRKKRPRLAELGEVQIAREGDTAIITPCDPDVAVTHFQIGPQLAKMSDEEILACFNTAIEARNRMAAEHPYVAIEIPHGKPQLRYSDQCAQWVPRGGVVRCVVHSDEDDQAVIEIDGRELSLEEFGRMLTGYAGWGMRIEFTPDDEIVHRPPLEVREPAGSND